MGECDGVIIVSHFRLDVNVLPLKLMHSVFNKSNSATIDEKDMVNIRQLILVPTTTLGVLEPMDIFNCHTSTPGASSTLSNNGHGLKPHLSFLMLLSFCFVSTNLAFHQL